MQLNIDSIGCFLGDLGSLRLSAFYSPENLSRGELMQKVARTVLSLFVLLSAYDFVSHFLPFHIKVIVNGSLCFLMSCLCLSLLLKPFQKAPEPVEETSPFCGTPNEDKKIVEDLSEDESPLQDKSSFSHNRVRRNLLAEFEQAAMLEG